MNVTNDKIKKKEKKNNVIDPRYVYLIFIICKTKKSKINEEVRYFNTSESVALEYYDDMLKKPEENLLTCTLLRVDSTGSRLLKMQGIEPVKKSKKIRKRFS